MRKLVQPQGLPSPFKPTSKAGKSHPHESATRQVQGQARYIDDMPEPQGLLYGAVGISTITHGLITSMDLSAVRSFPGVVDVVTLDDVPGHTDIGAVFEGDPLLADGKVLFQGQPLFAVAATSIDAARKATQLAKVEYESLDACLSVKQARAENKTVRPVHVNLNGDPDTVLASAKNTLKGHASVGGQEHMYLEGQISLAIPEEDDRISVFASSQHPSEVQKLVAEVLDIPLNKVIVDMRRMGGGFGGKESQAAQWSCIAALLASRTGKAVKMRVPRMQDMQATGKRHPFENFYHVAFDDTGLIQAADIDVSGNCGYSPDLSDGIVDRAMFHADNAYFMGDVRVTGHRWMTNTVSHTAFRGFGGPQGMVAAEAMLDGIARKLGEDPLIIRKRNLYQDKARNVTPYGMEVEHNLIGDLIARLEESSHYWKRREEIKAYNAKSQILKKGLALTPLKFGISFTAQHLNQAGALLHIYTDGSLQISHGGTEMGQGLHTKIAQICANEFGIPVEHVEVTSTRTDKVPNTSPTAASSGTDLNGKAAQNACLSIKQRLAEFAAELTGGKAEDVVFDNQQVISGDQSWPFAEFIQKAYFARISLSSTGFYKTPKIYYDRATGTGRPFFYFAYGASVSEVTVDTLTGEYCVNQVDILHDVGNSINPALDKGQIEGGFIQGMGWLTTEELKWDAKGKLISNNPATYKIPAIGDTPPVFNVDLYPRANDEDSIYHSKAVGEPPLMLAISVWCAIKDALSSIGDYKVDPKLDTPATPEKVLMAAMALQQELGA